MKNSMKFLGFFLFALTLSLMSCKGEDGAIGPVGPAGVAGTNGTNGTNGEDGRDGNDGTNGTNGQDGQNGNANVISSDWFSPTWSNTNSTFGSHDQDAPEVTQEVLDKAAIFIYSKEGSGTYLVPYSFNSTSTVNMRATLGSIRVWFTSEAAYTPPGGIQFRYVIIPPFGKLAPPAGTNPKQHIFDTFAENNVDINDYEQVAKFMNLTSEGLSK